MAKGMVTHANTATFDRVCTGLLLFDWSNDPGCRIVSLSARFGITCGDCRVCDRCVGTAVAVCATRAAVTVDAETALQNESEPYFRSIEEFCLFCGGETCDGESCFSGCFKCGSRMHASRHCCFNPKSILKHHGCFSCYDMSYRPGSTNHPGTECRERLRLLFFVAHEGEASATPFEDFFRETVTVKSKFYSIVVNTAKHLLKNRR